MSRLAYQVFLSLCFPVTSHPIEDTYVRRETERRRILNVSSYDQEVLYKTRVASKKSREAVIRVGEACIAVVLASAAGSDTRPGCIRKAIQGTRDAISAIRDVEAPWREALRMCEGMLEKLEVIMEDIEETEGGDNGRTRGRGTS